METTLTLNFSNIKIYDNYAIVTINEGVNLTPKYNNILIRITNDYFLDKPFVYISNRVHSYSVNPKIYHETVKIKNLVGIAITSKKYYAKINAQIEKMFFKKPFEIFSDLDDAIIWANKLVQLQNKQIT